MHRSVRLALVAAASAAFPAVFVGCGGSGTTTDDTSLLVDAAIVDASMQDAGTVDAAIVIVDAGPAPDARAPAHIDNDGGLVDELYFAVAGDTRPSLPNQTSGYPSDIITKIYDDIEGLGANKPPFVVGTGDYQNSILKRGLLGGNTALEQFDLFLAARRHYSGAWFPTMGNHECSPVSSSNCVAGSLDMNANDAFAAYEEKVLAPLGKTKPYYTIKVSATDGSWTSKFVFPAANAWDAAQDTWFKAAMAEATTYTFVIRHEPANASPAPPGVAATEATMALFPYTMCIVGHTHTYTRTGRELLVGNGGAPLADSKNYGYALLKRRSSDGAIVVDMMDKDTNRADTAFHYALKADGSEATP